MQTYTQRAEKVLARINELAAISEAPGALTRTYGSPAFLQGCQKVQAWMQEAGLQTRTDNIGNVRGRLESVLPGSKTFVIASHIDTVCNAGKFDGPLGVLLGLELLEGLLQNKVQLPFNLELIAFCDEEGVCYHTTYLGSEVVAGTFKESTLAKKDASGITLRESISAMGGNPAQLQADAIKPEDWLGYFEIHIEQGPVLYEKGIPVAIVTAIAGQQRIEISFTGEAGHAGTVPMPMRHDALCCAAACILEVEQYALARQENLVATVGKLTIPDAASNVIPGTVTCTLDIRSADKAVLLAAAAALQHLCREACRNRGITLSWNLVQKTEPVLCDAGLNELLSHAIQASGNEVVQLVSGAGHDAVPVSSVSPAAMLFVRCFKGISHNPLEDVEVKDMAAALQVADNFIRRLIGRYSC